MEYLGFSLLELLNFLLNFTARTSRFPEHAECEYVFLRIEFFLV